MYIIYIYIYVYNVSLSLSLSIYIYIYIYIHTHHGHHRVGRFARGLHGYECWCNCTGRTAKCHEETRPCSLSGATRAVAPTYTRSPRTQICQHGFCRRGLILYYTILCYTIICCTILYYTIP